jgi:tetratricopeptide (TPR) repeat protein
MRQGTCSACGMSASIRSFYDMGGKIYCQPCVWKAAREAKDSGQPAEYVSLADNTICVRCGADNGTTDFPLVAGRPFCFPCAERIQNWTYPQWLKIGLVGLLILLALALVHGRKYFHAGRTLYVGERLAEQHQYLAAIPYLQETLNVAPDSDKAALLMAKAALLTGNVGLAQRALNGHRGGHFEDNEDLHDVNSLWNRAIHALNEADEAGKLTEKAGNAEQAARMMHEAAASYPELPALAVAAEDYDAGAAYERKDYDTFVAISEKGWKEHSGSQASALLASALACKYAVTGDPSYKQRSEEMLEKSRQLVQGGSQQDQQAFQEYAERIRYRLDSRQIISTQEYNRKFRSGKTPTK